LKPKPTTWLVLCLGCLLVGVIFLVVRSHRPPVPLKVFQVATNIGLYGSMVLLSDGTLCVADHDKVHGLDANGNERWSFSWSTNSIRRIDHSLFLAQSNAVLVPFYDGIVKAYGLAAIQDGELLWEHAGSFPFSPSSSLVVRDDYSMVLAGSNQLIALDSLGRELWRQPTLDQLYWPAVVNQAGDLLYHDNGGTNPLLMLRSADGQELRRIPTGPDSWRPAFGPDGGFYVCDHASNTITSFAPDGTERWSLQRPEWALCTPTIASDGTIHLTAIAENRDPVLLAVHPAGHLRWSFSLGWGHALASPVLGRDGTIYLVTGDRWVRAIHPDGSLKWKHRIPAKLAISPPDSWNDFVSQFRRGFGLRKSELFGPPVLSPDGLLFVNFSHTGSIYVFDTEGAR
jgi:large repetitive protein